MGQIGECANENWRSSPQPLLAPHAAHGLSEAWTGAETDWWGSHREAVAMPSLEPRPSPAMTCGCHAGMRWAEEAS